MATPKIDAIITEFGRRIAMQVNFSNGALQNYSDKMTADVYMSYINRAMMQLFDATWNEVIGDADAFIALYPELTKTIDKTLNVKVDSNYYEYQKASPNMHIKTVFAAYNKTSDTPITVLPQRFFSSLKADDLPHYKASNSREYSVYVGNYFYLFAKTLEKAGDPINVSMQVVIMPVNPETGDLLTQNGAYDSPFDWTVNTRIAELAEKLFKADAQQTS